MMLLKIQVFCYVTPCRMVKLSSGRTPDGQKNAWRFKECLTVQRLLDNPRIFDSPRNAWQSTHCLTSQIMLDPEDGSATNLRNLITIYISHDVTLENSVIVLLNDSIAASFLPSYVGQTSRSLKQRYQEHITYIKHNNPQSAKALHVLNNKHE